MNIFRAIFVKLKGQLEASTLEPALAPISVRVPPQAPVRAPVLSAYIRGAINRANASESISELTEFARDYSGYIRQAAVSRCAVLAKPELLPVIVARLNDWVPIVRTTARAAVMTVMPFVPPVQLLEVLPEVQHLHAAGRADHARWIESFERYLIQMVDVQEFVTAVQGRNARVARACFHMLEKFQLLEPAALLRITLDAGSDILLALEGVRLIAALPEAEQRAHYLIALKSHFGAVRTIALRALLAQSDAANVDLAMAALLDLQSSVRDAATAFLRSNGFDVQRFYRAILQRQSPLQVKTANVALSSLAAFRNKEDLELVKVFASDARIAVRRAALTAWFKLCAEGKDEIAFTALMDEAPGVRSFALRAVRKHGAYIPFSTVCKRLGEIGDLSLLLLFAQSRVWDGLECIAQEGMRDTEDKERRLQLAEGLRDWLARAGRRYEVISAGQRAFLTSPAAMQVFRDLLADNVHLMKRLEMELSS